MSSEKTKLSIQTENLMAANVKVLFNCLLIVLFFMSCTIEKETEILPGAYQFEEYLPLLSNKKVGFYGNHTSLIGRTHTIDSLLDRQVNITTVFSPEHGIKGNSADGELIEIQTHNYDFDLFSLYGKAKKPTVQQLSNVEILLVDIQDVGIRFYTYSSTLTYLMEKCAELNIPVVILDRPNPNGSFVDGPILQDCCKSNVGLHPVPVVYGMTLGELAVMINEEGWLNTKQKVDLSVIPIKNWTHQSFYSLPVRPSPNLPNDLAISLYPSLGLFEGTEVSIGRGTNKQFQIIGHPLVPVSDFSFVPKANEGSKYPKLENETCYGESFVGQEPSYAFDLSWIIKYHEILQSELGDGFFKPYLSNLIGNKEFKKQIQQGLSEQEIRASWEPQLGEFKEKRKKYLLYP